MSSSKKTPSKGDPSTTASEKVRDKLVERRKELNLTQRAIADKVGVMESTIANWESGRRSLDWVVRTKRLCDALKMPIDDLVEEEEDDAKDLEELLTLVKGNEGPSLKELVALYKKETVASTQQQETKPSVSDKKKPSASTNQQEPASSISKTPVSIQKSKSV